MSGSPCIDGTRIRVMDIVSASKAGVSVDELQEYFSSRSLTLSEIHAALAYYFDHQDRDRMTLGETVAAIEEIAAEPDPFAYGYRFIQPRS